MTPRQGVCDSAAAAKARSRSTITKALIVAFASILAGQSRATSTGESSPRV
jgi:hypothetical protein